MMGKERGKGGSDMMVRVRGSSEGREINWVRGEGQEKSEDRG